MAVLIFVLLCYIVYLVCNIGLFTEGIGFSHAGADGHDTVPRAVQKKKIPEGTEGTKVFGMSRIRPISGMAQAQDYYAALCSGASL